MLLNAGDSADALYFMTQWSIPREAAYPYTSGQGIWNPDNCNMSSLGLPLRDKSWMQSGGEAIFYPLNDEVLLQAAVTIQPIIIYWNMGLSWNHYAAGIYTVVQQRDSANGCQSDPAYTNHAMVVVGYNGTSNYWIIQNSFGTGWGEQGFARVEMTGDQNGPCGMYTYVLAPSMTSFQRFPPDLIVVKPDLCKATEAKVCYEASVAALVNPLCALSHGFNKLCFCRCKAAASAPSPPPPPPPLACPLENKLVCSGSSLSKFLACDRNLTMRSTCPCTCQAVGFCHTDYSWCYAALQRAPNLSKFCSNASVPGIRGITFAGYALSCPCWCSRIPSPPLPLSVNWTASGRLSDTKGVATGPRVSGTVTLDSWAGNEGSSSEGNLDRICYIW